MRFLVIAAAAAALLLIPATTPAGACPGVSAKAATADLSAATEKKAAKKPSKAKEKVQYMRAAPWK